jgi:DivIVA domain-containing protein
MTINQEQTRRQPTSAAAISNKTFPRRLRGLDETEVYQFLDGLADQVQAMARSEQELRAENERLQGEVRRVRAELEELESRGGGVNDQVVELFSQAQLVAEEMVEEASRDTRERLGQARMQERQILEEAMSQAEQTRRDAEALIRWTLPGDAGSGSRRSGDPLGSGSSSSTDAAAAAAAAAELEQVRSYARAAQAQMKSLMDAFSTQVGRMGGPVPEMPAEFPAPPAEQDTSSEMSYWQVESSRGRHQGA